jgi:uncharacterized membrane protein YcaP (DUF421 family)
MEKLVAIALRVAITYLYLLIIVRLSGKRSVAEGTPFDLVVALIISDLPDDMIWGEVPLAQGVTAMATLITLHLVVALLVYHSPQMARLFESVPSPLVLNQQPIHRNMAFERVNDRDLDAMLREQKVDRRSEVEAARLETSGLLSARRTEKSKPAEKGDLPRLKKLLGGHK